MANYLKYHERQRHMKERLKYNSITNKYIKHINKHNNIYLESDNVVSVIVMRLGRQR